MNKLGVIQVIDSLEAGGAEVLAVNIANALHNREINSHLCVTRKEGVLKKNIDKATGYLFLEKKKSLDLNAIFRFKNYLKKHKISIIHAHSTSFFLAFCVKLIYPKVKIIWHDHYGKSEQVIHRKIVPLNLISHFFKSIISVNSILENWAIEKLNCKNVFFLNNFPFFSNQETITKLQGIHNKRIIHLAAFREQKDHLTLISAFQYFLKENKDWTLHLIGNIANDEYSNKIVNTIKEKKLQNNIFVYGSCLDIYNILNQSTIGVLSSKSEGLPVSLLEYGLASLPVIVTNVGECSKVVNNNVSGLVINSENSTMLSKALTILANSVNLQKKFSQNHHLNVLKNYSRESFIRKLLKIYNL